MREYEARCFLEKCLEKEPSDRHDVSVVSKKKPQKTDSQQKSSDSILGRNGIFWSGNAIHVRTDGQNTLFHWFVIQVSNFVYYDIFRL